MISLFHADLLPWLAAVAVPVVIHFVAREPRTQVGLPTVRFLKRATARQGLLFRFRYPAVLILRALAIGALVLAFCRPALVTPLSAPRTGRAAVVFVLDAGAGMSFGEAGVTAFNSARTSALKLLYDLRPGDEANVILCDAQPHAVLSGPSGDFNTLSRALREARVTEQAADPNAAITLAVQQLARSRCPDRRLYVLSNFQRTCWGGVQYDGVPSTIRVLFVSADVVPQENAGITAIRVRPNMPRVGQPVTVECDVFNSSTDSRRIPLTLALSTGRSMHQDLLVPPFQTATAHFACRFDRRQRIECKATIPADRLPLDDARRAVIDLRRPPTVILITGESTDQAGGSASILLRGLRSKAFGSPPVQVITVKPSELDDAVLNAADAVLVCDAPQISDAGNRKLSSYVADGGRLIWFLSGEHVRDRLLALARQLPRDAPLPMQIDRDLVLSGSGKGYVALAASPVDSPLLSDVPSAAITDLAQAQFHRICTYMAVDPRAQTLLKYEEGTPAAVSSSAGRGTLMLVNMVLDSAWSDLAARPAFPLLLGRLLTPTLDHDADSYDFLPEGRVDVNLPVHVGQSLPNVTCTGPDGAVRVALNAATGSVSLVSARRCGFYRFTLDGRTVAEIAVNPDAGESDLRAVDPTTLEPERLRQNTWTAGTGTGITDAVALTRGERLWPYLILASLLCLCAEPWVGRLTPKVRR